MPPQKVSEKAKEDKQWQKQCVDAIIGMSNVVSYNGRTTRYKKQVNYDLYNSRFDEADFSHVLNPYGSKGQYGNNPAKMQDYNIIRSKLELLKGEEMKRPFNFKAIAVNGEAVTAKETAFQQALQEAMFASIASQLGQKDEQGNPIAPQLPESVQKYFQTQYVSPQEVVSNQILKYLVPYLNLGMKFNQGFEHSLIVAEEIYYIGIVDGEPIVRVVNPKNFDYDKSPDLKFIQEAQWAKEERRMATGNILDEYGEFLSETEVDRLDKGTIGGGFSGMGMLPGFAYTPDAYMASNNSDSSLHIPVTNVVWRSMRKIGFLTYYDENGETQETIVPEDFKLDSSLKQNGATLEFQWISEIWEGTRIGADIYCNVRPLPNQPDDLPYIGYIYNNTNSQATSVLDFIKPHQYTYIIVWYRLENELAKSKGKKFVMDMAMLPKSKGWTLDQWMYYFDNMGVAWINSAEEGREGDPNSVSKFNQFTSIDMALSQVVQQYMLILDKLEQQVSVICGVSPQREAQISPNETASGVERSVAQSTAITEPLFYYHNLCKQKVLTRLLEVAKVAYRDGRKIQFAVDDTYSQMLKLDGGMLQNTELGVFITDSAKDQRIIEKMEALGQMALQNDKATLSDYITILETDSVSLMKSKIISSEQQRQQQGSQQYQQELQQKQEESNAQQQQVIEQRNFDAVEAEKDRELQRNLKQMDLDAKALGGDSNSNGIPDATDIAKLQLEREALFLERSSQDATHVREEAKLLVEHTQHLDNVKLKQEELRIKEEDSIRKAAAAKAKAKQPTYKKKPK